MTDWLPIETAPKDGTAIIGRRDGETVFICAWFFDDEEAGEGEGDWLEYGSDVVRPRHWIAIPPMPGRQP